MASEMIRAIYAVTSEDKPVTAAGVCYVLRDRFVPIIVMEEAERCLEWLCRNGYLVVNEYGNFGAEYLRKPRE